MDWKLAIRRNRDALRDIAAALFVLARMRVGGSLTTLPRSTVAMILMVLRPAESAVRRLIVIAALTMKAPPSPLWGGAGVGVASGSEPPENTPTRAFGATSPQGGGGVAKFRVFALFDPLKSFDSDSIWNLEPVYESGFGLAPHVYSREPDHTPVDARALGLRLNALMRALDDIGAQARRLKRWELKRNQRLGARKPTRLSPMRPGLPPGWRERPCHAIDPVLKECHGLALDLLFDSS